MINLERFRQIWAQTSSPSKLEADAALRMARTILALDGRTERDVPYLLEQPLNDRAAELDHIFAAPSREPSEERARRDEVIAQYGSLERALTPTWLEAAVVEAAVPLELVMVQNFPTATYEVVTLDGWGHPSTCPPPPSVIKAVANASPLPETVTDARTEYDFWCQREGDLFAVRGRHNAGRALALACEARFYVVQQLFISTLRSASLQEVILRQQVALEHAYQSELLEAVLMDLEALA